MEFIAVDLETTGLNVKQERILEIGAVHRKDGETIASFSTVINPQMTVLDRIYELTHITESEVENAPILSQVWDEFQEFLGDQILVGHHLIFDYSFLKKAAVQMKESSFSKTGIDTLTLSRMLLPSLEHKNLNYVCEELDIALEGHHRALADAMASAEILETLYQRYGEEKPELFYPKPMHFSVKKESPITPRQKERILQMSRFYHTELTKDLESLTKNEASRIMDVWISLYGKMPK